jgi:hypothetical protein
MEFVDYYNENVTNVKMCYVYINSSDCIEYVNTEHFEMQNPNIISSEELIKIIKTNNIKHDIKYTILSILKININLIPQNLNTFMEDDSSNFTTVINNISPITFEPTILMFQELNSVIILFREKHLKCNLTKKNGEIVNKTRRLK